VFTNLEKIGIHAGFDKIALRINMEQALRFTVDLAAEN
jgi:hypothetical protein